MQTLATLVHDRAAANPDDVAIRARSDGWWQQQTWRELADRIDHIAAGLLSCGVDLAPGDSIAILAPTSADWIACDFAGLSIGVCTVPIYTSLLPPEVGYVHVDTAVRIAIVSDARQYEKIREVRAGFTFLDVHHPAERVVLEHVVVIDPSGLPPGEDWESLADLEARGSGTVARLAGEIEERRRSVTPDVVATYTYTSGTTGAPKAVVQTARNHLTIVDGVSEVGILGEAVREGGLFLFLPLAHSFGRLVEFAAPAHNLPIVISSVDTLAADLAESRPGFVPAAPRVYDKVQARVEQRVAAASPVRRRLFAWAMSAGRQAAEHRLLGRAPSPVAALRYKVADALVLGRVRATLGLDRAHALLSGAAPLQPDVHWFFLSLGLELYEAYGLTETCPGLSANRPGRTRIGTVGVALPGVELRIAPDGEILARGANITSGYHHRPEETRAVFDDHGWFRTGDEGTIDDDGFLTITGRKKDLIKTSGGKYVAPSRIEGALKLSPLVQDAVVVGDGRHYCTALLSIDQEQLDAWAAQRGIAPVPDDPAVAAALEEHVARVNTTLASFETVKHWSAVDAFTVESGLLTASMKVKRTAVEARWRDLIDDMYRARPRTQAGRQA